jgi:hypothetical protein
MGTRSANSYYTASGQTFALVTGGDMAFLKEDLQYIQAAVNGHDHSTGYGKPVDYASLLNKPTSFTAASHVHDGVDGTPKLAGANTHQTPDTDAAVGSLHHTIGVTATTAAAGNHTHTTGMTLVDPLITGQASIGTGVRNLPTVVAHAGEWRFYKSYGGTTTVTPATGEALCEPGATALSAVNATYVQPAGESVGWYCDGTNWFGL